MRSRFPSVPRDPFWSADDATARAALAAIDAFVAAVAEGLGRGEPAELEEQTRVLLAELVGASRGTRHEALPYKLFPYPTASSRSGDAATQLRGVLLWRAGVVDFAADAWDTIGASFAIDDCRHIGELFTPEDAGGRETCTLCLGALSPSHFDSCPVQRAWRGEDEPRGPLA